MSGNKIAILYSTSVFKHHILGGLAFDEMLQVYLKLGLNEQGGFYRVAALEQTVDTLAFVGKFVEEKICLQLHPVK